MNIWIVTTGSSDVQLVQKHHWRILHKSVTCSNVKKFAPKEESSGRFSAPPRVMGTVYSQTEAKQYNKDLIFPLLDNFAKKIEDEHVDINQIILIVTDQTKVFSPEEQCSQHCAYWQDTSKLQPILETYLQNKFPQAELKAPILLQPESSLQGLDNWDYVLNLVLQQFSQLEIPDGATIYVSHQAGTPAISSAVQFSSLTKFGARVKFLVSSERDPELTTVLESSTYLQGIRLQEAKALLARHDYAGVQELLSGVTPPEINKLLDAAIQWSCAEFDNFAGKVYESSDEELRNGVENRKQSENWWWTAYEAAYLGVIRLKQENTVEAMFHSFRAVEGLLLKWAIQNPEIDIKGKKITLTNGKELNAYGKDLYFALEQFKGVDETNDKDIWEFGHYVFNERNKMFHKLAGLKNKEAVFEKWHISIKSEEEWEKRVLNCLNFIAGQKQPFNSLKEASLMSKVHEKLDIELNSMSTSKSNKSE